MQNKYFFECFTTKFECFTTKFEKNKYFLKVWNLKNKSSKKTQKKNPTPGTEKLKKNKKIPKQQKKANQKIPHLEPSAVF